MGERPSDRGPEDSDNQTRGFLPSASSLFRGTEPNEVPS